MINTWAIMQKAQADRLIYINSDDERSRRGKQACCGEQACPALECEALPIQTTRCT